MEPLAEAFTKTTQLQTEAAIETARIHADSDLRKVELEARSAWRWNLGVLMIVAAIAAAGIAAIFTGQAVIGEKLLFGVIGFFGGYGAAIAGRRKP